MATVLAFIPFVSTTLAAVAIFGLVYLWQRKRAAAASPHGSAAPAQLRSP